MKNKLDILWLGHSCFLLDDGHIKICIDPYKDGSVPNLKLPSVSCNYVFKSHNHDDHNFLEGVMVTLNKVEDPNVEIISSYHDDQKGALRGKNDIHIFYLGGYKIVHFGDIGCSLDDLEMEKLKNSDLFLMPINGYYTIGSEKAYQMFKILKPKIMIPMHYFYNNSGYKDDNQISKLINLSKADIIFCPNKNIHLEDYLNNDTSKILILDSKNL